jgi:FkbM family methyltransferase
LDFSQPGLQRYRKWGITLSFPGTPEDDSIEAYTQSYKPQPGDLIFDAGAHAGFTTVMLAKLCGPSGHVIAFEPDGQIVSYLEKNIAAEKLSNVTIVPKALDGKTGTSYFNQDGTMSAGLVDYSVYGNTGQRISVETLTLEDACREFGVPKFIKMDIEGAEVDVIRASGDFLKRNPIHLSFDSYHRMQDGRFTYSLIEPMLRSYGYDVRSGLEGGQMFTWATPKS